MYKVLRREGAAKRAVLDTAHGTIHTPVFMNVGTSAAIKGGLSTIDLVDIGCQVQLSNTYHLHLRPGDDLIHEMGGLRSFMRWDGPVLTDSGGFQVFSLAQRRKISEAGVSFASHIDGRAVFIGPEESVRIQKNLGSTIAMAFDECIPAQSDRGYVTTSVERTTRWLFRCQEEHSRLNYLNNDQQQEQQLLFGINQGGLFEDIRIDHAKRISDLELPGYAIGGLAVGETHEQMYHVLETTVPHLPTDKPTYLMGVGTPQNILEAVSRGVDFFDCVLPARNGRHGTVYTQNGILRISTAQYATDPRPIDRDCMCPCCREGFSRSYIRHLFKAGEVLAMRLCVLHNLFFYNNLMAQIRQSLDNGNFHAFRQHALDNMKG